MNIAVLLWFYIEWLYINEISLKVESQYCCNIALQLRMDIALLLIFSIELQYLNEISLKVELQYWCNIDFDAVYMTIKIYNQSYECIAER